MRQSVVAVFIIMLTACVDHSVPTSPQSTLAMDVQLIACEAKVSTRTISCDAASPSPAPGLALSTMLGSPYAKLASSGTAYSGTTLWSSVTIQNQTAQPMGTADGTTADAAGIRVFFQSGPTVTSGSGTVTVGNPDGQGTFSGTNQPYYQYAGPLAPHAISPSKSWHWTVPNTVNTFTFSVLVSTRLPDDGGVLRWINETGAWSADLGEVSQANNEIWAVGANATILHYNGTSWSTQTSPVSGTTLRGVEMYAGTTVTGFAVGDNSTILRYDGASWNMVTNTPGGGSTYTTLCRIDASNVYVVGAGGNIGHSTDNGAHFTQETPPQGGSTDYFTCGGTTGDVYVSGLNGVILHSTGNGTWTQQTSNTTNALRAMAWIGNGSGGTSEIWLSGGTPSYVGNNGSNGTPLGTGITLRSTGSGTWTTVDTTAQPIRGLRVNNASQAKDIYGVGSEGFIFHYNRVSWSSQYSGTSTQLNHIAYRQLADGSPQWWVVGNAGIILLGTR